MLLFFNFDNVHSTLHQYSQYLENAINITYWHFIIVESTDWNKTLSDFQNLLQRYFKQVFLHPKSTKIITDITDSRFKLLNW